MIYIAVNVSILHDRTMALSIKDPEADRLVRELAAVTGESITEAARKAFAERLQRERAQASAKPRREILRRIIDEARADLPPNQFSEDEILGYGQDGIPH